MAADSAKGLAGTVNRSPWRRRLWKFLLWLLLAAALAVGAWLFWKSRSNGTALLPPPAANGSTQENAAAGILAPAPTPTPAQPPPSGPGSAAGAGASQETVRPALDPGARLPTTLTFASVQPETGVIITCGAISLPVKAGQSLDVAALGHPDPTRPLTLTASAAGHKSRTLPPILPGSPGTGLSVFLIPEKP